MLKLKIRKIGNSLGVVLPQDALAHLHAREGNSPVLVRNDQGVSLTRCDDVAEQQTELAKAIMAERQNVLRVLAK